MRGNRVAVGVHLVMSVLLAAGSIWLTILSWGNPLADAYYWRVASLLNTLVWLVFAFVGGLVWLRKPENSVGWVLSAIGFFMLADSFIGEYSFRGLIIAPGSLPIASGLAVVSLFLWVIPIGLLPVLMLVYPTGGLISRVWVLATLPTVAGILAGVVSTVLIWPYRDRVAEFLVAEDAPAEVPVVDIMMGGTFVLFMIGLVAGVIALIIRWRAGISLVRRQITLLLFAAAVLTIVLLIYNLIFGAPANLISELIIDLSIVGLPVAVAMAILRYRLYDIDRIISRSVSYALVLALLGLVVLGLVSVFALFLPSDDPLVVAVSTLVVFALFTPVSRRVQAVVDRRFNRSRYDAGHVMDDFAGSLRHQVDTEELIEGWVDVVSETMQPAAVGVWLRR